MTEGELYLRQLRGLAQVIEPGFTDEEIDVYLTRFWSTAIQDLEDLGGDATDSTKYEAWRVLGRNNERRLREVLKDVDK